jgi:hypothetical protein
MRRSDRVASEVGTMTEIQRMLANATRVDVAIVLFRNDFYDLAMEPVHNPAMNGLEGECWRMEPQSGWTITADSEDNMTAPEPEPYDLPQGWRYVATMAVVLIPDPNRTDGMCFGRGMWFPMAGINPTPQIQSFLDILRDETMRRAKVKAGQHRTVLGRQF